MHCDHRHTHSLEDVSGVRSCLLEGVVLLLAAVNGTWHLRKAAYLTNTSRKEAGWLQERHYLGGRVSFVIIYNTKLCVGGVGRRFSGKQATVCPCQSNMGSSWPINSPRLLDH